MGFGGNHYRVPPAPTYVSTEKVVNDQEAPQDDQGWVVKERPLGFPLGFLYHEPTNTGNTVVDTVNSARNFFRHDQLIKKDTGENVGFFGNGLVGDGEIRSDDPENMEEYIQTDPTTYPSDKIEPKIRKVKQEQERTRSRFYELRNGSESLGSTNSAYDEPYFYNAVTENCQDFVEDITKEKKSKKSVNSNNIKSPFIK